ncbi:MAG: hydantoinase/oxoprolinase family protein, partial [Alphaproteobacteria bacterium]
LAKQTGETPAAIVSACDLCINGTTVALNALIQHKGARTGLIATAGHEDSIEIRLGHKEEGHRYDAQYPAVPMLVPRYLRRGVRGRIRSDGVEIEPLNEDDVRDACAAFRKEGVEAVAISFVWSVLDPSHERRAAEIVRAELPDAFLAVGSEVYPQVREYTRTSTTVVNAYLGPIPRHYVKTVDDYFAHLGAQYPVRYFQSNGGLAIGQAMSDRAVYAINSGPASAPQAGRYVAGPLGYDNIITVDMGGTSFDITLTKGDRTNIAKDVDFLRYRIGVPMIQVETLGAGGGSIAQIDKLGLLAVGPESAGATPGPACYGNGGTEATVTDANVVLGYLNPESLLGGRMTMDAARARAAVSGKVAEPLGITPERAAYGIFTIVNNNMVNGIRRVSIEQGYDPRDFVLIGAGGAAGCHITAIARVLGIKTVLVPKLASVLCAFGQIISDVKYNYLATHPMRIEPQADLGKLQAMFDQMEAGAVAYLEADGFARGAIDIERSLDMRYVDQVHECTVDIGRQDLNAETIGGIRAAFDSRHQQLFTYAEPHNTVEIVNLESTVIGRVPRPEPAKVAANPESAAARTGSRPMIFSADGAAIDAPVYDGAKLGAGGRIAGPAVIEEETTTLVIEPGWTLEVDGSGVYVLKDDRT